MSPTISIWGGLQNIIMALGSAQKPVSSSTFGDMLPVSWPIWMDSSQSRSEVLINIAGNVEWVGSNWLYDGFFLGAGEERAYHFTSRQPRSLRELSKRVCDFGEGESFSWYRGEGVFKCAWVFPSHLSEEAINSRLCARSQFQFHIGLENSQRYLYCVAGKPVSTYIWAGCSRNQVEY